MRKAALILATVAGLVAAVAAPSAAEARRGFGPGLAGGLIAAAVIGGIASSAYAHGPRYGYAPAYYGGGYGGYAPAYYGGGYGGYAPAYYGGYAPAYYGGGYAPAYYGGYAPAYHGYRVRRVVRPVVYYGGPRYYGVRHHHRLHRHW